MSFYTCENCERNIGYSEQVPWKIVSPHGSIDLFCSETCIKKYYKEMD